MAIDDPILMEWINSHHLDVNTIMSYRSEFLHESPFPHLYLDDFLVEDKLAEVIDALAQQEFEHKESDLFSLAQTDDFAKLGSEILLEFKSMLKSIPFLTFIQSITDLELSQDIDCLGNIYTITDYLLCHDDELLKRKLAYILYLTDLHDDDGGGFHLYKTVKGKPTKIVKSVQPRYNRFIFFKVTRSSFHEVGEILKEDIYRVSISGWFNND